METETHKLSSLSSPLMSAAGQPSSVSTQSLVATTNNSVDIYPAATEPFVCLPTVPHACDSTNVAHSLQSTTQPTANRFGGRATTAGTHHRPCSSAVTPLSCMATKQQGRTSGATTSTFRAFQQLSNSLEQVQEHVARLLLPVLNVIAAKASLILDAPLCAVAGETVRLYSMLFLQLQSTVHSMFSVLPRLAAITNLPTRIIESRDSVYCDALYSSAVPGEVHSKMMDCHDMRISMDVTYSVVVKSMCESTHQQISQHILSMLRMMRGILIATVVSSDVAEWIAQAQCAVDSFLRVIVRHVQVLQQRLTTVSLSSLSANELRLQQQCQKEQLCQKETSEGNNDVHVFSNQHALIDAQNQQKQTAL